MMVFDGDSGALANETQQVVLEAAVSLMTMTEEGPQVLESLKLADGDGMCMGYHGWLEGDYGEATIATKE